MARVYIDEQIASFALALREAGHDVVSASELGRRGRSDAWHFRRAVDDGRVIVTWNRSDFEYLHKLWSPLRSLQIVEQHHGGILTAAPGSSMRPDQWLPLVRGMLDTTEDMRGRLLCWVAHEADWREVRPRPDED